MGMNIRNTFGKWEEIGGSFDILPAKMPLVTERREKYSFPFGDAELVQIAIPDIHVAYGELMFKDCLLQFRVNDAPDTVEFHYVLSGDGSIYNSIYDDTFVFQPNQQNMIYMPELDGTGKFNAAYNYRFFEVHFAKGLFLRLAQDSCKALQVFAEHVAAGRFAKMAEQNLPISLAMHGCIRDIMNCKHISGLKLLFLQAKCIELLVLQAEAFELASTKKKSTILKSAYDRECIYHARDYLLQHMCQPPSITELAKISGVNEFKLKQGFKELFAKSVFSYLSDHRLDYAKDLLHGGKSIKYVAEELGYSSVQHFSTAFRKKFSIPPGRVTNIS
jgi:AraC family transcriptional activator of pyochelin receptor